MGVIDHEGSPAEQRPDRVRGNIAALLKGGGGEGFVKQQQAPLRALGKQLPEAPAFLPQPAQIQRFVLVRGKMGKNPVRRGIDKPVRRHIDTRLGQQEKLAGGLGYRGFSSPVRPGQQVDPVDSVEGQVVPDRSFRRFHHGQPQVVKALRPHFRPFGFLRLRLAETPSGAAELFPVFRPPDVEQQLGNQVRYLPDADGGVPVQHLAQLPDQPGQQMGQGGIHGPGNVPAAVAVRHGGQGHGQQRIPHRHACLHRAFQPGLEA